MKKFQQGNWVNIKRNTYSGGHTKTTYELVKLEEESKVNKGHFRHSLSNGYFFATTKDWELWMPSVGDTCWAAIDDRWIGDHPQILLGLRQLVKIIGVYPEAGCVDWEMNNDRYTTSIINCEPFFGTEPTLEVTFEDPRYLNHFSNK